MSEGPTMASSGGRKRLVGTRPLAETRGQLATSARRLKALIEACTRDCEDRLALLRHLPACASVAPFAAIQDRPPAGAEEAPVPSMRGLAMRGAHPMSRDMATGVRPDHGLAVQTARPARATAVTWTRPDDAAPGPTKAGSDALLAGTGPDRLSDSLTAMSRLAGALVDDLIARFPHQEPRPQTGRNSSRHPSRLPARPAPTTAQPVPFPYSLVGSSQAGAVPGSMQLAAKTATARTGRLTRPLPPPIATASASIAALVDAGRQPARAGAAAISGGVPLLARMLAELAPAGAGRTTRRQASPPGPAPRAASRLFGPATPAATAAAANPQTGGEAHPPAAPESDPTQDTGAASSLARELNRVLIDQAWLRGVDLS